MNAPAVATVTTLAPPAPAGTKILRIFISYASEDVRIATAIFKNAYARRWAISPKSTWTVK